MFFGYGAIGQSAIAGGTSQTDHLASAAHATASSAAVLEVQKQLAAAAASLATAGQTALEVRKHLAADAAALATLSASIRNTKHLAAAVTSVATAQSVLDIHKDLGATAAAVATGTGALDIGKQLAAAAAALTTVTADLLVGTSKHLAADAQANTTLTANLELIHHLTVSAATSVATAQSVLQDLKELVATMQAQATAGAVQMDKAVHLGAIVEAHATGTADLYVAKVVPPFKPTVKNTDVSWQAIVSRADPSQAEANRRELEYPFSRRKFYGDTARRGPYH